MFADNNIIVVNCIYIYIYIYSDVISITILTVRSDKIYINTILKVI